MEERYGGSERELLRGWVGGGCGGREGVMAEDVQWGTRLMRRGRHETDLGLLPTMKKPA